MAQYKKKILKLSKGQIAEELIERTDINLLDSSGQRVLNFQNSKYGLFSTVKGTKWLYSFGTNNLIKLFTVQDPLGINRILVINATSQTMFLLNDSGQVISNVLNVSQFVNTSNYKKFNIAQNNDLIIFASEVNPLLKLTISGSSPSFIISLGIWDIPIQNIVKSNLVSASVVLPSIIMLSGDLPTDTSSIDLGTAFLPNAPTPPSATFPWNVKVLQSQPDPDNFLITNAVISDLGADPYWTITDATINNPGSGYTDGDQLTDTLSGATFTYNAAGPTLTINNPSAEYTSDPSGTNLPLTGGTGTDITADITSMFFGYTTGEIITDISSGAQFTLGTLLVGSALTINSPTTQYSSDPAGTDLFTSGGGGTGLKINIYSSTIPAQWSDATYTAQTGQTVQYRDTEAVYYWNGTAWVLQTESYNKDTYFSREIEAPAVAGAISLKIYSVSIPNPPYYSYLTITAPSGFDPYKYALGKLAGSRLVAKRDTGVCWIEGIDEYTVSGQNCNIIKLRVSTIVPFLKAATKTLGFTIEFSRTRCFDSGLPGTANNPEGTQNYPLNVLFYQQRTIIAGTQGNSTQMLFSQIGKYDNFGFQINGDSGFQLVIGTQEKEVIKSVLLGTSVLIFTDKSEWFIPDTAITALSGFSRNSGTGSIDVQPILSADGTPLFVPNNGKGLIGLVPNELGTRYDTPYISMLTNLFTSPIVDMSIKKGYSTLDDTFLLFCLEDGRLIIGNYLADQQIQSFMERSELPDSKYLQTFQTNNKLFFLVNRNGNTQFEVEDDVYTEGAVQNPTYNPSTGIITLNSRYNGTTINVYDGDRKFVESGIPSGGSYTIQRITKPSSVSEVGFNINSYFESNPINVGIETFQKYKSISRVSLALKDGSKPDYLTINGKFGRQKGNWVTFVRPVKPDRDARFIIDNNIYPCDIMSIELDYEA